MGDVFAVHRTGSGGESDPPLLGRVISTSAIVGPTHGCALVYVFAPGADLSRDRLLLPPFITTRAPWSRGYFAFLRSEPLLPGSFFERHCFDDGRGHFYDEESRPIEARFEPCAPWRLYEEVAGIEGAIAAALAGWAVSSAPRPGSTT